MTLLLEKGMQIRCLNALVLNNGIRLQGRKRLTVTLLYLLLVPQWHFLILGQRRPADDTYSLQSGLFKFSMAATYFTWICAAKGFQA